YDLYSPRYVRRPDLSPVQEAWAQAPPPPTSGAAPADAGPEVPDAVRLPFPVPLIEVEEEENRTRIHGVIVHIDRFGNLITNVGRALFDKAWTAGFGVGARVILKNRAVAGWVRYYEEAGAAREDAEEKSGALFNSWGLLEVFVPSGNAAELLDARVDEHVTIEIHA
ncbi:MAG: SAM-dependent chlorinase/fluorinase, partial [Nitrospinota bacterium]|nr:SAM-dependent chlorinase/fluorinase [Nitrospinota bacterium]